MPSANSDPCPRARQFILARHGESEYSAIGRLNGDVKVAVPLTAQGIREARALGEALTKEQLELCMTSEFLRARETADVALEGRDVPRVVDPRLNDPLIGRYEGGELETYRAWASGAPSSAAPEGGGESRLAIVGRYAQAFRDLVARRESTILVVCHSLPVSYALGAREGTPPGVRVPLAEHATPYRFTAAELAAVAELLEDWVADPTW